MPRFRALRQAAFANGWELGGRTHTAEKPATSSLQRYRCQSQPVNWRECREREARRKLVSRRFPLKHAKEPFDAALERLRIASAMRVRGRTISPMQPNAPLYTHTRRRDRESRVSLR